MRLFQSIKRAIRRKNNTLKQIIRTYLRSRREKLALKRLEAWYIKHGGYGNKR
ncbi:MAG: hypothetical protein J4415_01460 [Candidatus Diapherotrites archaeon]|uniref:Uncharacterized protein n=1 Tax=Candidatus Iainarchaeum sp. TaxID=3101447 RepID=A0A8T4KT58_9ARCH|nr:hypothetical protein [Candidatus Diapherotrites archaeon]